MNLNMESDLIKAIADRGRDAGEALIHEFVAPEAEYAEGPTGARNPRWPGWDSQRWVRLDVLIRTMADKSAGLFRSLGHALHLVSHPRFAMAQPYPSR
jgi:hypothetical protein